MQIYPTKLPLVTSNCIYNICSFIGQHDVDVILNMRQTCRMFRDIIDNNQLCTAHLFFRIKKKDRPNIFSCFLFKHQPKLPFVINAVADDNVKIKLPNLKFLILQESKGPVKKITAPKLKTVVLSAELINTETAELYDVEDKYFIKCEMMFVREIIMDVICYRVGLAKCFDKKVCFFSGTEKLNVLANNYSSIKLYNYFLC